MESEHIKKQQRTYTRTFEVRQIPVFLFGIFLSFNSLVAQKISPEIKSASGTAVIGTFKDMVERKDRSLNSLIDENASLYKIATGFGFTEGITWVPGPGGGYLLFSDMAANVIYRRDTDGKITTYLENSGYPYQDIWRVGMRFNNGKAQDDPAYEEFNLIGSDGMVLSHSGALLIATWTGRSVDRLGKDGKRVTLADHYQGKRFGGPNDLVELTDGGIYFTDTYGSMRNPDTDPANELKTQGVYYFKEGHPVIRVIEDIPYTNGVAASPDEKYLYVNGSVDRFIRRYEIQPDRSLRNGKLFIDLSKEEGHGITDGMKIDSKGNLWTTGPGGIWIVSPEGKPLGLVRIPDPCTNLVFGDNDKKTLFISTPGSIYKIQTKVSGL